MTSQAPSPSPIGVGLLRPRRVCVIPQERPIIVTVDGPAGTGKSSVSRELAHRLGLDFLDTGAMYRAATAIMLDRKLTVEQSERLVAIVMAADLHFDWNEDPPVILAWDKPIDHRIRDADVTEHVSPVSAIGQLREHMVLKQRIIGHQHPRLVTEGRDQGSVVFPDAEVKFFLWATPEVRAARRADQLRAFGIVDVDETRLCEEIQARDLRDSTREIGPLVCPPDAIRVDTSDLSFEEVVGRLERDVRSRVLGA